MNKRTLLVEKTKTKQAHIFLGDKAFREALRKAGVIHLPNRDTCEEE